MITEEEDEPCTLVLVVVTRYPAPEDDEDDYCPEGEVEEEREEEWGEDSLVRAIRWMHPSQCPVTDPLRAWFVSDSEQDFRTGEYEETAYFLSENATEEQKAVWVNAVKRAMERGVL
jgi:hypothetical protein